MPPLLNLEGHYSHIKNGRFYSTVHFLKYILPISARHRQPANSPTAARRPRLVTMVMLGHTDQQLSLLHLRPADSPLCRASIAGSHAPSRRPLAENSAPRPQVVPLIACLCVLAQMQGKGCRFSGLGVGSAGTAKSLIRPVAGTFLPSRISILPAIFFLLAHPIVNLADFAPSAAEATSSSAPI